MSKQYQLFASSPDQCYMPPSLILFDLIRHNNNITVDEYDRPSKKISKIYSFKDFDVIAVLTDHTISFAEKPIFLERSYHLVYTQMVTPVFDDHTELLATIGPKSYPLPPWVLTWLAHNEQHIDAVDKLLSSTYDVGASRLGFARKNKREKCRLDPTFAPLLIQSQIDVDVWAMGLGVLKSPMNNDTGATEFETSLFNLTYGTIMTRALGRNYKSLIEPPKLEIPAPF